MSKEIIPAEEKYLTRSHFLQSRKALSHESRFLLDTALFSNAAALPQFISANTILCYYPIKGEPNIIPLVRHAIKLGKTVAFPLSHVKEKRLSFHIISDLSELTEGAYGIPEPARDAPKLSEFSDSLCLVPALAYDSRGHRLGYGGGYYDRFLSQYDGISLGLTYDYFFVDSLPTEEHDVLVDMIITEKGEVFRGEQKEP